MKGKIERDEEIEAHSNIVWMNIIGEM